MPEASPGKETRQEPGGLGALLRSTLLNGLLILSILVWGTGFLLVCPGPFGWRFAVARHWARSQLWLIEKLAGLSYRVEGRENIPAQACVVLWKHESAWETLVQLALFGPQSWVLKRELLWIPFFGWACWLLGCVGINRHGGRRAVEQVVQQGRERLAGGQWMMIFPEGTRVWPGETRRFGVSGALLARAAGVPVLPIAMNAGDFWRRREYIKRPGTITVSIGPPVATAGRDADDINQEAHRWIEAEMRRISPGRPFRPEGLADAVDAHYRRRRAGWSGKGRPWKSQGTD